MVGRWYSRALNWWGVELEKLGRLNDAADAFGLAHRLNPGNVAAQINLDFNRALQSRDARPAVLKKSLEERVGRYGSWNALLAVNGPMKSASARAVSDDDARFELLGELGEIVERAGPALKRTAEGQ